MATMRWLAAALLVVLAACGDGSDDDPSTTTTEPPDPTTTVPEAVDPSFGSIEPTYQGDGPRVVVLGDSLTVQSREALGRQLAGYALKVGALRGEGLAGGPFSEEFGEEAMLAAARLYAPDDPEVVVLALGTNDAWSADIALPAAREAWRTMTDLFDSACIVGVTIVETTTAARYDADEARAINELITEDSDQVVDWRELGARVTAGDGIHVTPEGAEIRAEEIRRAVEACPED
jgi:lysophospholipase L1-like esterase